MFNQLLPALILFTVFILSQPVSAQAQVTHGTWWPIQSIDTMKYSRDLAREKKNVVTFDSVIETQIQNIAAAGATHVAIATPYDEEFLPFLKRWVDTARNHKLNVWFRGNWSGWEGWFDYPKISRAEHLTKTIAFIAQNETLFREGDIFSSCPECENGGPGDPRLTGDITGFRKFLIDEQTAVTGSFRRLHIQVRVINASNADVIRLVMDRETTAALGGVVVIDHYVKTPDELALDITEIAASSGGKVVVGELGVPIPDIHGLMTEADQAVWLNTALEKLTALPEVMGLNYWVGTGGSTEIWTEAGKPKPAVSVLTQYFHPEQYSGWVKNSLDQPIKLAQIKYRNHTYKVDASGVYHLPIVTPPQQITVSAPGYTDTTVSLISTLEIPTITLTKTHPTLLYRLVDLILRISRNIIH